MIRGEGGAGPIIGPRADMDALPIEEMSGKPWSSSTPGKMHGCSHDVYTVMLLGAAKHLAATRKFRALALIFQPAEEILPSGARRMVSEGIFNRVGISQVYGMHNDPGLDVGAFTSRIDLGIIGRL